MLRFPLRLTADLTLSRLAQMLSNAQGTCYVQFLDVADVLHYDSTHPVSHPRIREINSSRSPVIWMGGSEPLDHPGISHLVRAITQRGHFVFLETDGTQLRRRIHEFQPVSRLFLTVRLEAGALRHNSNEMRARAFELAAEGIRAARLSGFLICIHSVVSVETELSTMAELVQIARSLIVDGMVITPRGGSHSPILDSASLQQKTNTARRLVGSRWWDSFSRLLEPVLSGARCSKQDNQESGTPAKQEAHANEEGVRVA